MSRPRSQGRGAKAPDPYPIMRVVTATEAAKNFGAIVNRVQEDRAHYLVERSGTPVAQIGPVQGGTCTIGDLVELLRSRSIPHAGADYQQAVEEGVAFCNRAEVPDNQWEH